jgi:uncharacterized protein
VNAIPEEWRGYVPHEFEVETASGRYVDMLAPQPHQIAIEDVAHGLARECRFGNQARRFYSVAEHAVLVARKVLAETSDPAVALAALHHDDAEAYTGDVPRPLKLLLDRLTAEVGDRAEALTWRSIERTLDVAIAEGLGGLWRPASGALDVDVIRDADDWAVMLEAAELLPSGGRHWCITPRWPLERPMRWICGMPELAARHAWLKHHDEFAAACSGA